MSLLVCSLSVQLENFQRLTYEYSDNKESLMTYTSFQIN